MNFNGCVKNEMSCAGIKTYPRFANLCTKDAVKTCEASVQQAKKRKNKSNIKRIIEKDKTGVIVITKNFKEMRNRKTIIIIGSILVIMYLLSHLKDYL